jgi:hypothetical protein
MTVGQHLKSLRKRIVENAKEQGRLVRAHTFRKRRSKALKAEWKAAQQGGDPGKTAKALLRYRKSLGLQREINSRLDTFEEREAALRKAARRARQIIKNRSFSRAWGGAKGAADEAQRKAGLPRPPISSEKRAADHPLSISNPDSDHNEANEDAYARDYATFDGCNYAKRLAAAGGGQQVCGTWGIGFYTTHGLNVRQQVIWNAPDGSHRNHTHAGYRV